MRVATRLWITVAFASLLGLGSCSSSDVIGSRPETAAFLVRADLSSTAIATVEVEVTAPDLATALVFNIPIAASLASGTITVPAGANRTITLRAYDAGGVCTHSGSVTVNIQFGTNPVIAIVLTPLTGGVPIQATMGTFAVTVAPAPDTLSLAGSVDLTATILDWNGLTVAGQVVWGTLAPAVATVATTGLNTGHVSAVAAGQTMIVATYGGTAAAAAIVVLGSPATKLAITTGPTSGTLLQALTPLVVQLKDASNNPVARSGVAVTAALTAGAGTLSGVLTQNTDVGGAATFTGLVISGTPGMFTIAVSSPGLAGATTSFNVQAVVTGGGVLFHSDWSTATGHTDAALRDAGKALPFDGVNGNPAPFGGSGAGEVIAAMGFGFPTAMAHVLRITRSNIDSYVMCSIGLDNNLSSVAPHWPQLSDGTANYWRVYLRVDIPDSEGDIALASHSAGISHHPLEMGAGQGEFEPTNFFSLANGTMAWDAYTWNTANSPNASRQKAVLGTYVDGIRYGQTLPKSKVLRFEWMYRRITSSSYTIAIRIYDATNEASGGSGVLMWSEDGVGASQGTIMSEQAPGTQVSMASQAGLYLVNIAQAQSISIGENGGWHSYSQNVYFYWGGLCLRNDTWCGAYSGGI